MKLKQKLLLSYLGLGLIPVLIISLIAMFVASNALEQQAYDQLTSIKEIKKKSS